MIVALVGSKKNIVYEVGGCVRIGSKNLVVKNIELNIHWDVSGQRNGERYVVYFVGGYILSLPFNDYGGLYKADDEAERWN